MAGKLESIEIFPGDNGSRPVVHNFKREAGKKGGAMLNPFEGTHHQRVYSDACPTCRDSWHPRAEF